jgi:hypothetical protein
MPRTLTTERIVVFFKGTISHSRSPVPSIFGDWGSRPHQGMLRPPLAVNIFPPRVVPRLFLRNNLIPAKGIVPRLSLARRVLLAPSRHTLAPHCDCCSAGVDDMSRRCLPPLAMITTKPSYMGLYRFCRGGYHPRTQGALSPIFGDGVRPMRTRITLPQPLKNEPNLVNHGKSGGILRCKSRQKTPAKAPSKNGTPKPVIRFEPRRPPAAIGHTADKSQRCPSPRSHLKMGPQNQSFECSRFRVQICSERPRATPPWKNTHPPLPQSKNWTRIQLTSPPALAAPPPG